MPKRPRLTRVELDEYLETGKVPESYIKRQARKKQKRAPRSQVGRKRGNSPRVRKKAVVGPTIFWGLDGEGVTENGVHRYNLMVAAPFVPEKLSIPRNRFVPRVLDGHSIRTFEALMWLTEPLPGNSKFVTFSFNYDLTKILQDLDPGSIYELYRPELRKNHKKGNGFYPVLYPPRYQKPFEHNGLNVWFKLDWLNGKFTVTRMSQVAGSDPSSKVTKRGPVVIFDIFKFFGKSFVGAIRDWKVPRGYSLDEREELHRFIEDMKQARGRFAEMTREEVLKYCTLECIMLGELATLLIDTHQQAGIPLKPSVMYGAGSSGDAMLRALGVSGTRKEPGYCQLAQRQVESYVPELKHAIMCAFVGGRFENSMIGVVKAPLYSGDISSAYPYQCCFLPDLMNGRWELTRDRSAYERAEFALVRYRLNQVDKPFAWAPFPYRIPKGPERGSITYPAYGSEGWVWKEEFVQGERGWSGVEFVEAWVFHSTSERKPLADMAKYYMARLAHGKEGVGLALKLGLNSGGYGKFAQTLGGELGKYTNWVWAGMITSGCRAQMLQVANLHKDLTNLLMIATDGYVSAENVASQLPIPRNTNTFDCLNDKGEPANKPLGGWEHKIVSKDMAFVRPGIYFPLDPTAKEIDKMRARGIGRNNLARNWKRILNDLEKYGVEGESVIGEVSTFHGAKTSIYRVPSKIDPGKLRVERSPLYGQWSTEKRFLNFNPLPKRAGLAQDGKSLMLRVIDDSAMSAPYAKGENEFAKLAADYQQRVMEQPDYDWFDNMFDEYMAIEE